MITPHKMYFSVKEYYLQNKTLDISSFHLEAFLIEWNKEAELCELQLLRNTQQSREEEDGACTWCHGDSRAVILEYKVKM